MMILDKIGQVSIYIRERCYANTRGVLIKQREVSPAWVDVANRTNRNAATIILRDARAISISLGVKQTKEWRLHPRLQKETSEAAKAPARFFSVKLLDVFR
ncbi:UNVERIFIED_CONTAM: hypothetical protein ABID98_002965 [Brevibacillus sp. OAP136]